MFIKNSTGRVCYTKSIPLDHIAIDTHNRNARIRRYDILDQDPAINSIPAEQIPSARFDSLLAVAVTAVTLLRLSYRHLRLYWHWHHRQATNKSKTSTSVCPHTRLAGMCIGAAGGCLASIGASCCTALTCKLCGPLPRPSLDVRCLTFAIVVHTIGVFRCARGCARCCTLVHYIWNCITDQFRTTEPLSAAATGVDSHGRRPGAGMLTTRLDRDVAAARWARR